MSFAKTKAQLKKEQILKTALEIVKKKGFQKITMEEIGAELLLTKGSLYYYFKNKEDLIFQCHKHVLSQGMEEFKKIINENNDTFVIIKKMVGAHLDKAINERETFNLLMSPRDYFKDDQYKAITELRNEYEGFFSYAFQRGRDEGHFHTKDIVVARLFIMGGLNWIQQWYKPGGRLSKEEIKDHYYNYILKILI